MIYRDFNLLARPGSAFIPDEWWIFNRLNQKKLFLDFNLNLLRARSFGQNPASWFFSNLKTHKRLIANLERPNMRSNMHIWPYLAYSGAKYVQVGCPWLDLAKCSSDVLLTPNNLGKSWSKSIALENKVVLNFRHGAKKSGHLDYPLQSYGQIYFNIFRYILRKACLLWFSTS